MTDRELLEAAAKAAGFGDPQEMRTCWTESEYPRNSGRHGALWNYVGHGETAELWNPLTDDGDALRLAVKLNLDITFDSYPDGPVVEVTQQWGEIKSGLFEYLDTRLGADSAARRAIVRAAAEIGKATP